MYHLQFIYKKQIPYDFIFSEHPSNYPPSPHDLTQDLSLSRHVSTIDSVFLYFCSPGPRLSLLKFRVFRRDGGVVCAFPSCLQTL